MIALSFDKFMSRNTHFFNKITFVKLTYFFIKLRFSSLSGHWSPFPHCSSRTSSLLFLKEKLGDSLCFWGLGRKDESFFEQIVLINCASSVSITLFINTAFWLFCREKIKSRIFIANYLEKLRTRGKMRWGRSEKQEVRKESILVDSWKWTIFRQKFRIEGSLFISSRMK